MPLNLLKPEDTPNSGKSVINDNFLYLETLIQQLQDRPLGLRYQGTWNAATNTPTLTSGGDSNHESGDYYTVNIGGVTDLDGENDWQPKDWVIYSGSSWQKLDQSNVVTSVNGQTGDVSLVTGVSSINGASGDVVLDPGITSDGEIVLYNTTFSLDETSGELTYIGVSSINGQVGDVTLNVATDLSSLQDVADLSSTNDGDLLVFNQSSGAWESGTISLTSVPDEMQQQIPATGSWSTSSGSVENTTISLSHARLYGVKVELFGLTPGQSATVRFFGDSENGSDLQYEANFTDAEPEDTAQAWRYRNRNLSNEMYVQIENTSSNSFSGVYLEVTAEPF